MEVVSSTLNAATLDPARVAKLCQGVGACLIQYQQIEAYLKLLLPHMHRAEQPEPLQPMLWRALIDSKTTLGPLIAQFKEKTNAEDPDGFDQYLSQLVDQRNDTIHHRFTDPLRPVNSAADLEDAICQIQTRISFAAPFVRALNQASIQFKEALDNPSFAEAFEARLVIQPNLGDAP